MLPSKSTRFASFVLTLGVVGVVPAKPPEPPDEPPLSAAAQDTEKTVWLDSLTAGYRQLLVTRQPLLVRIGGEACPWCHKLAAEFEPRHALAPLHGFTLVSIDAEKSPDDALRDGHVGHPLRLASSRRTAA